MVFLVELEGDGVSRLSSNGARREREITGTANDNTMIGASAGGGGRRRAHGRGRGGSGLWRGHGARSTAAGQCVRFVGGELVSRVHGEDHPLLTVICLSAVHPKRVGCLDDELSNGEGTIHITGGDWYTEFRIYQSRNTSCDKGRTDNPVSKPPTVCWQGLAKVDWVTV